MECECGKRQYESKKAVEEMRNFRARRGERNLRIYPCRSGFGWHLTHRPFVPTGSKFLRMERRLKLKRN